MVASKAERDRNNNLNSLKQEKKTRQRKRDGPSNFYYEDENRVDLDYKTTQKFGLLEVSPPIELDHIEGTNKRLVSLREALKMKGSMEQAEGRAKFSRDTSYTETEEYAETKAKYQEVDEETRKCVDKILSTLRFRRQQSEDEEYKGPSKGRGERRDDRRGPRGDDYERRGPRQGRGGRDQSRRGRRD